MPTQAKKIIPFNFNISLSVLNHLGRNLYRRFSTILGEAISNSWDADAQNVWITIDRDNNVFSIQDDGLGMTSENFQRHFLTVGYSKRDDGVCQSPSGRPFIGRKGIGKLALLSCSDKIHITTKVADGDIVGGIIDNTDLDIAIKEDDSNYPLGDISTSLYKNELKDCEKGTFLFFEGLKDSIKNTPEYLRTIIALYFRFSTIDPMFHIFVNGTEISEKDLQSLVDKTEFLWNINELNHDPLLNKIRENIKAPEKTLTMALSDNSATITGFVASVDKPSNLKIRGTEEIVTIDLFVNGRLREKDIMKHLRTTRVVESYLYGQINYNSLDDDIDRFTSSRESVKEDDPKFKEFLKEFKTQIIALVMEQWDVMRDKRGKDGDPDNSRITTPQRKAKELFNATLKKYIDGITNADILHNEVESWVKRLREDAQFNFLSYAECFVLENLIRCYISHKKLTLQQSDMEEVAKRRKTESDGKAKCGMSIDIRLIPDDLYYLDMTYLANVAEVPTQRGLSVALPAKAKEFKPIRDALMHTSIITDDAKTKLTSIFNEVKDRIKHLLKLG
jgi:hypothetical protein